MRFTDVSLERLSDLLKGHVVQVEIHGGNRCDLEEIELFYDDGSSMALFVSKPVGHLEVSRCRFHPRPPAASPRSDLGV